MGPKQNPAGVHDKIVGKVFAATPQSNLNPQPSFCVTWRLC